MLFTSDQQTLEDLNIFGRHGSDSIYSMYNRTRTRGGSLLLEEMFRYPLSDLKSINQRSSTMAYFTEARTGFPFESSLFDMLEQYLENKDGRTRLSDQDLSLSTKLSHLIGKDADTALIFKGVRSMITFFQELRAFLRCDVIASATSYHSEKESMEAILSNSAFDPVWQLLPKNKIPDAEIAAFDSIFRFRNRHIIAKLLRHVYLLDVYLAVATLCSDRGFVFAVALPSDRHLLQVDNVYHPQVSNAVANSLRITPESNVVFLTGANMAGKSTFMKSLSISLFLAHMGFPVAASQMSFSVLDGLFTTINLPDNLGMGTSHFYAEVLRVKKMVSELKQGKNLFILFDELFRGTNVKDAYEATIACTEGFARKRNSLFIISTHIIEAGEVLKERCDNIQFVFLPTLMEENKPVYTYKLESGITADRHGMIIIKNEGILDILQAGMDETPFQQQPHAFSSR